MFGGPRRTEVFTLAKVKDVLAQAKDVPTIDCIFFEGGEPILYYALLHESIRLARRSGFNCGIVTNGYWATSLEDAKLVLKPLVEAGLSDVSVSCDDFHGDEAAQKLAKTACDAATSLGCDASLLSCELPGESTDDGNEIRFRGRAMTNLLEGIPLKQARAFDSCPYEELREPERIHIDPLGYVHLCQGIVIGNVFEKRLAALIRDYMPERHPIIARLLSGGPAKLAEDFNINTSAGFADACHLCFEARTKLREQFCQYLAPEGMYGEENETFG
ncbi:hypothetical protein KKG05_02435 [bacterium]|nr:hypothetical protein [bacterium]